MADEAVTHLDVEAVQRLMRAATDQGYYNLARLLKAAAASIVTRTLAAESLPKTDRALADGVAVLLPQLRAAQLEPELLALIDRAGTTLAAGDLILYADAPPIWVCRACGQVALRTVPDHCPQCGAGQLVFEFFPATFYLEPLPVPVILDQFARTPDWLAALIEGVSDAQAAQSIDGVEGAWSLHEAIGHILDTQELIAQRVNLFMQSESPNLTAAAMWGQVESASLTVAEMTREVQAVACSDAVLTPRGIRRTLAAVGPAYGIRPGDTATAVQLFCQTRAVAHGADDAPEARAISAHDACACTRSDTMKRWSVIVIIGLMLTACQAAPEPTAEPTPTAESTATDEPTTAPTATSAPTFTPAPPTPAAVGYTDACTYGDARTQRCVGERGQRFELAGVSQCDGDPGHDAQGQTTSGGCGAADRTGCGRHHVAERARG